MPLFIPCDTCQTARVDKLGAVCATCGAPLPARARVKVDGTTVWDVREFWLCGEVSTEPVLFVYVHRNGVAK